MKLNDPAVKALIRPGMGLQIAERSQYDYDYWNGRLLIWELPESDATYTLGVDVAEGMGKDRSVVEVIRNGDRKRPDEQVAEFACDYLDMMDFSPVINVIGRFYRDAEQLEALCNMEMNGPGDSTHLDLKHRLDYGNFFIWKVYDKITNVYTNREGFWTTRHTRPKLIGRGMHALKRNDLIVHSEFLLDEMADFHRDHYMARAAAISGMHDDRVMALLLAYWAAHDDELLAGEDVAEERRVLAQAQVQLGATDALAGEATSQDEPVGPKPDWFNLPVTAEQMYRSWDEQVLDE